MAHAPQRLFALLALCLGVSLSNASARADWGSDRLTVYVSPGFVYSGLDRPNGKHALGAELSVPLAWRSLAAGPFTQVQWTPRGAHYVVGAEIVYYVGALELGWFKHDGHDGRSERRGFSGAALFGVGLGWIGPRVSVTSSGDVSVALNLSLKAPLHVHGCHWVRATFSSAGC